MENGKRARKFVSIFDVIKSKDTELCMVLLESGFIDVNAHDDMNGNITPLMCAAEIGCEDIFELILARPDVDINAKDKHGQNTFVYAVIHLPVRFAINVLSHKKYKFNAHDEDGYTELLWAVDKNRIDVVKKLLSKDGVVFNAKSHKEQTALSIASRLNHVDITKLLLDHCGIDITIRDTGGLSAFDYAVKNSHVEIIKLFLARGLFVAPHCGISVSDEINEMLGNKKTLFNAMESI